MNRGPYNKLAMHRAIIDRNRNLSDLPEPYHTVAPFIYQSSLMFVHSEGAMDHNNLPIVPSSAGTGSHVSEPLTGRDARKSALKILIFYRNYLEQSFKPWLGSGSQRLQTRSDGKRP